MYIICKMHMHMHVHIHIHVHVCHDAMYNEMTRGCRCMDLIKSEVRADMPMKAVL